MPSPHPWWTPAKEAVRPWTATRYVPGKPTKTYDGSVRPGAGTLWITQANGQVAAVSR